MPEILRMEEIFHERHIRIKGVFTLAGANSVTPFEF